MFLRKKGIRKERGGEGGNSKCTSQLWRTFFTFQSKFGKDLESIHNVKYVNKINTCVVCMNTVYVHTCTFKFLSIQLHLN